MNWENYCHAGLWAQGAYCEPDKVNSYFLPAPIGITLTRGQAGVLCLWISVMI